MNKLAQYSYLYLHGFASYPNSSKAQFFLKQFNKINLNLIIPDLNQDDFSHLTLTRQIDFILKIIKSIKSPLVLIGSSMGGLTSLLLAETISQIEKIILFAPAIKMSQLWQQRITEEQLNKWKHEKYSDIFHYAYNKEIPLHFEFYQDLFLHQDAIFKRQLPALIFHGIHDTVVPIKYSKEYALQNKLSQLIELDDDHSVNKELNRLWQLSLEFIVLKININMFLEQYNFSINNTHLKEYIDKHINSSDSLLISKICDTTKNHYLLL